MHLSLFVKTLNINNMKYNRIRLRGGLVDMSDGDRLVLACNIHAINLYVKEIQTQI